MENSIKNWVPLSILQKPNDAYCKWLYVGDKRFTEPFFDETISKCKYTESKNQTPFNSISSVNFLPQLSNSITPIAPTAFIFHISRCGSTLLSQMLSLLTQNIVLSEVPFIDSLLRKGLAEKNMQAMLPNVKAAIDIYCQKRSNTEKNVFIKLDSWHIHFYKELRQLYPTTPFFLLYRNPYEVLQSQQKKRGIQSLPNYLEPEIFGFTKEQIGNDTLDEYMVKVLETYLDAFITNINADKNAFALNYHNGINNLFEKIKTQTKLIISTEEQAIIKERVSYNAKIPDMKFIETLSSLPPPLNLHKCTTLFNILSKIK